MADAIGGFGATLTYGTNSSATAAIGEITNITFGNFKRDSIDVSSMSSSNRFKEFIAGMVDPGEITVDMNYDGQSADEASIIISYFTAITNLVWRITLNDNTTPTSKSAFIANGFVTDTGIPVPFDGKVTQSLTIKLTGQPTFLTAVGI